MHQENRGVSAARNAGLSRARGTWTAFVDGDDSVEPDMLACLHDAVRTPEAALHCYGISKDFHTVALPARKP
ncbi:MAG: glycosyltransferase family 2 protein [Akkermansia sp.]